MIFSFDISETTQDMSEERREGRKYDRAQKKFNGMKEKEKFSYKNREKWVLTKESSYI